MLLWSIRLLSALFSVLLIWLFSFLLADIDDIEGPQRHSIEALLLDQEMLQSEKEMLAQIAEHDGAIKRQTEIQSRLEESMANAGETLKQMTEFHRFRIEKGDKPTLAEEKTLSRAQTRFMDAQDSFQAANTTIGVLEADRHTVRVALETVQHGLAGQRKATAKEFNDLWQAHRRKIGAFKLAFIVPVLLLSAFFYRKHRKSLWKSILFAFLFASFWKVGVVMHEHFPSEFFKYIAIAAAIIIVFAFLVFLLKSSAKPDTSAKLKRYSDAYQRGLCAECAHPFAGKGIGKVKTNFGGEDGMSVDKNYNCPSCGTSLFHACEKCEGRRHSRLPHCVHCGAE